MGALGQSWSWDVFLWRPENSVLYFTLVIEDLQVEFPEIFIIAFRENLRVDPQLFINEIFRVHIRDHRRRKSSIRPLNVKSETEFAVNNQRKTTRSWFRRFSGIFNFLQANFYKYKNLGYKRRQEDRKWSKSLTFDLFLAKTATKFVF